MWLENLKELKKAKGVTCKQIADATKIPESTIKRIFSGDTEDPYVSTIHRIVAFLGGSLDHILANTNAVLSTECLAEVKESVEVAEAERKLLISEIETLRAKTSAQETEILLLRQELKHKDEIFEIIKYFAENKQKE